MVGERLEDRNEESLQLFSRRLRCTSQKKANATLVTTWTRQTNTCMTVHLQWAQYFSSSAISADACPSSVVTTVFGPTASFGGQQYSHTLFLESRPFHCASKHSGPHLSHDSISAFLGVEVRRDSAYCEHIFTSRLRQSGQRSRR